MTFEFDVLTSGEASAVLPIDLAEQVGKSGADLLDYVRARGPKRLSEIGQKFEGIAWLCHGAPPAP